MKNNTVVQQHCSKKTKELKEHRSPTQAQDL